MHKLSIIIPTLNEEKYLPRLLSDLQKQSLKPHQIIVIDAGSNDLTAQKASQKFVQLLHSHPPVGHQRDEAGRKASGEILVYFDADARLTNENVLDSLAKEFLEKNLDIACPLYIPITKSKAVEISFFFMNLFFWATQRVTPSGGGSCIVVKKTVFSEVGGFRSDFTFEDIEFIRRASRNRRFAILKTAVHVSDRRFFENGVVYTIGQYLLLSFLFSLGLFKFSNKIPYSFGRHQ